MHYLGSVEYYFGNNKNELATVHLVQTYCLPSVLYGCETWNLDRGDYHRLNVLMELFVLQNFCLRESVSCVMYCCQTLPML